MGREESEVRREALYLQNCIMKNNGDKNRKQRKFYTEQTQRCTLFEPGNKVKRSLIIHARFWTSQQSGNSHNQKKSQANHVLSNPKSEVQLRNAEN